MKILMVAMNSIHFQRWVDQFKNTTHDIYWFDIKDGVKVTSLSWVTVFQDWRHKYPKLKGRYLIKKYLPWLNRRLNNDVAKAFEKVLLEVKPDIVHSFVLYISCTPILGLMQKYKQMKWVYSSWGSDLYYYKNIPEYRADIIKVLSRVNYLITDCKRDISIAKNLGFKGEVLGTFPGGGGFDFSTSDSYIETSVSERNVILIKGYQGRSGKAIQVLKALSLISKLLKNYQIIVFGAYNEVEEFIKKHNLFENNPIEVHNIKTFLPHKSILEFMAKTLIYIGNSNSDGMPNTLLEAIIMGAFPIQSNPGNATKEIITHDKNGLLINDCNNIEEIKDLIEKALSRSELITSAFHINQQKIKPKLERGLIRSKVLKEFSKIE